MIAQILILFLVLIGGTGCTRGYDSSPNETILEVNGEKINAGDFGQALAKKLKNYDALAAKDPINMRRAKETVLREAIVSSLLLQYAKEQKVTITPAEVDEEVQKVRKSYPDDLTFKASLATEGQSVDMWKKSLEKSLLEKKVFSTLAANSPEDVLLEKRARSYYDDHRSEFERPAQTHLLQIVVPRGDDGERLLHKLKEGASFSELAKKFSTAPEGINGGDLGYVSKGTLPLFDSAFNLRPGQLSAVIKSSYGFHIMKVLDKKPSGQLPFEKAKPQILRRLIAIRQQEVFSKWLEEAMRHAKIKRNDALLERIKVRTEGANE